MARDWIPGLPLGFSQRVSSVKEWRSILPLDKLFASGYESNRIVAKIFGININLSLYQISA